MDKIKLFFYFIIKKFNLKYCSKGCDNGLINCSKCYDIRKEKNIPSDSILKWKLSCSNCDGSGKILCKRNCNKNN